MAEIKITVLSFGWCKQYTTIIIICDSNVINNIMCINLFYMVRRETKRNKTHFVHYSYLAIRSFEVDCVVPVLKVL